MPERKLYRCAGIVGTGLIGGSLGLALREEGSVRKVLGYDEEGRMLGEALRRGAVEEAVSGPEEIAGRCDLVFLAVPVRSIPDVMRSMAGSLEPGTTVSDVGSVKEAVVNMAGEILPGECHFIGGHPLAGSEQRGVGFADPMLLKDTYYALTPTGECDAEAYSKLHALLTSVGARVIAMEPRQHDRAMSVISHLPHIMAMGLMNLALERAEEYPLLKLAAGGFRDMTRIAASGSRIWLDILMENRDAVEESLGEYISCMHEIGNMLEEGRERDLVEWMEKARSGRQNLAPILHESLAGMYDITLSVEDRPGVISDVSLTVGEMGINIEDIELVHPLESGSGLLRLMISGEDAAARTAEALRDKGYRVSLSKTLGGE
ncbi:MAG: prephenate dehydrogenase [Actinomycetota bacterium]|nr:prephenate dehydrogenase [Actinomycetota bacterium]